MLVIHERFGFDDEEDARSTLASMIAIGGGTGEVFEGPDGWALRWIPAGANTSAAMNSGSEFHGSEAVAVTDGPAEAPAAGGVKGLLDFIAGPESNGNYNAYYLNAGNTDNPRLTAMTLAEVRDWQDQYVSGAFDGKKRASSAAGRYQIIRGTLDSLIDKMNLDRATVRFDEATQDKLAIKLLEGAGLAAFKAGNKSDTDFANAIARIWAGVPVVTDTVRRNKDGSTTQVVRGASYYSGDGLNEAGVGPDEFLAAVNSVRN